MRCVRCTSASSSVGAGSSPDSRHRPALNKRWQSRLETTARRVLSALFWDFFRQPVSRVFWVMGTSPSVRTYVGVGLALVLAWSHLITARAQTPSPADGPWSGEMVCVLSTRGTDYQEDQTHTWRLTGEPPLVTGSIRRWPAVWSVQGGGRTSKERWTIEGRETSAPITIFEMPGFRGNPTLRIESQHAQLTAREAIRSTLASGDRRTATVWEWQFPRIDAENAATVTTISDSRTRTMSTTYAWQRPDDAVSTETCKWRFTRDNAMQVSMESTQTGAAGAGPVASRSSGGLEAANRGPRGVPGREQPDPSAATPPAAPAPETPTQSPTSPQLTVIPLNTPALGVQTPQTTPVTAQPPLTKGPASTTSSLPVSGGAGGGFTAAPTGATTSTTPVTPVDPRNFTATQTAEGTVVLRWDAVPGAGAYMLGGPGTNVGISVNGTSHTVTGIPQGTHTWTVATNYATGGILTTPDKWSKVTASVSNSSGRYRVLLAGFRVNRETFDDRTFGNGDEVYASAAVTTIDRRSDAIIRPRTLVRSDTYGDTSRNPERVQAGSFSPTGGLKAGDVVPAGGDPRTTLGTASATRFPLILWEGVLRDGIDAVVVNPVLWEADGNAEYYDHWSDGSSATRVQPARASAQAGAIRDRATRGDLTPFPGILVMLCQSNSDLEPDCKQPGNDRQIGISNQGCTGDTFTSPYFRAWCELTIVFTREGIERTLSAAEQIGSIVGGLITVNLLEPGGVDTIKGGFNGSYEMYVRVERLP